MMKNCDIIRILNKRGEELLINASHPNAVYKDYSNYIQVASEFLEWSFSTAEEKAIKE